MTRGLFCFFTLLLAAEPAVNLTICGLPAEDEDADAKGLAEVSEAEHPEAGRDEPLGFETVLDFDLLPPGGIANWFFV